MIANDIKLTIAIPTFNRVKYLKDLLPDLVSQCTELNRISNEIELLINNNDSPDSTEEYIQKNFSESYISYYKNQDNIGAQNNFFSCIERAKGRYVWLFGDDELIAIGGVKIILDIINNYGSELIIAGDKNHISRQGNQMSFNSLQNFYDYFGKFYPGFIIDHTLITFNIFIKRNFNIQNSLKYRETDYAQMYGLVNSIKNIPQRKNLIYIAKTPSIIIRKNRPGFEYELKDLLKKQKEYIEFIGRKFNNRSIVLFASSFYYKKKISSLVKRFIKKIPYSRQVYELLNK